MCVYLRAKFEFSSIILKSLDRAGNFTPSPLTTSKPTAKKPTQIRVKSSPLGGGRKLIHSQNSQPGSFA